MGTGKKERSRLVRQGKTGTGMDNIKIKGENFYRDAKKVKTINMRKDGRPQRNADGKIVQAAKYQSRDAPIARVEPNRKWFTNTRVISQDSLKAFRDAMAEKEADPYRVLLKSNKLPMSLIRDGSDTNGLKKHQAKMAIESSPFAEVFGSKAQRKRVKLSVANLEDLVGESEKALDTYKDRLEQAKLLSGNSGADGETGGGDHREETETPLTMAIEPIFNKGQSKRIWNELYKVIDSSDVVIHVLDARDPLGTRCRSVEKYLKTEAQHKHLIFVLNKCDLVPTSVAAAWVRRLSADYPTLAFHSSITNPFGKGSLIQLLRQFSALHKDRKQISVGFIGYPNTGKSSIINTLRKKKVCTVAPIPGETAHHMERTYELKGWNDHIHFLELLARKGGRLLKGGEPDVDGVAKMVLNDFMRGKIPWFTPAPIVEGDEGKNMEGRGGRLGEITRKRKRDDLESVADTSIVAPDALPADAEDDDDDDDEDEDEDEAEEGEFGGFDNDDDEPTSKAVGDDEDESEDSDDMIPLEELSDVDDDSSSEGEDG